MSLGLNAQTLIINEVSQGDEGSREYVEFVVIDDSPLDYCTMTSLPCLDIRGWIFDDNSGYHGPNGIAGGALRFSYDPLWECVPLGTIITVYNGGTNTNPLMPAVDISTSDGNCVIVAPVDNTNLFETNTTTPDAVACSYPSTGWTAGGNWTNISLVNGNGDCARVMDLSGCEVFSVCYLTSNQNNLIYFTEGIATGTTLNTVFYFNGSDPYNQANWTVGCADAGDCGMQEQTPGAPNNALNAAYIASFNNNCMPLDPLIDVAATVVVDGTPNCDGEASATASGSVPGYSYEWLDENYAPIGQNTENANQLCGGVYYVIATSSTGCKDTATVEVIQIEEPEEPIIPVLPPSIIVPNVFSPNGDNVNDGYSLITENIASLEFSIINRWGQLMFKSNDVNGSWDGKEAGNDVKDGVYFVRYVAEGFDGTMLTGHGFVEVFR